jgi:hypothetical protein
MMTRWQERTLELLIEERRKGTVLFSQAWRHATNIARSEGIRRPNDFGKDYDWDEDWLPFSAFWRRALRREWEGLVQSDYAALVELLEDGGLSLSSSNEHQDPNSRIQLIA